MPGCTKSQRFPCCSATTHSFYGCVPDEGLGLNFHACEKKYIYLNSRITLNASLCYETSLNKKMTEGELFIQRKENMQHVSLVPDPIESVRSSVRMIEFHALFKLIYLSFLRVLNT